MELFSPLRHYSPAPQYTMPNTYLDKAFEVVPELENQLSYLMVPSSIHQRRSSFHQKWKESLISDLENG